MPRHAHLDDLVRTLIAYLESEGTHPGYPQRRHSIRKACASRKLRNPSSGPPAPYATVWNRLDKALRGPLLHNGGRGAPVAGIDPATNALVLHSFDRFLAQFPPSRAAVRETRKLHPEQPALILLYLCFFDSLRLHYPRPPLNIVHCIADRDERCSYLDPRYPSLLVPSGEGVCHGSGH